MIPPKELTVRFDSGGAWADGESRDVVLLLAPTRTHFLAVTVDGQELETLAGNPLYRVLGSRPTLQDGWGTVRFTYEGELPDVAAVVPMGTQKSLVDGPLPPPALLRVQAAQFAERLKGARESEYPEESGFFIGLDFWTNIKLISAWRHESGASWPSLRDLYEPLTGVDMRGLLSALETLWPAVRTLHRRRVEGKYDPATLKGVCDDDPSYEFWKVAACLIRVDVLFQSLLTHWWRGSRAGLSREDWFVRAFRLFASGNLRNTGGGLKVGLDGEPDGLMFLEFAGLAQAMQEYRSADPTFWDSMLTELVGLVDVFVESFKDPASPFRASSYEVASDGRRYRRVQDLKQVDRVMGAFVASNRNPGSWRALTTRLQDRHRDLVRDE